MNRLTSRLLALAGLLTVEVAAGLGLFVAAFAGFFYLARVVFVHHSQALDTWAFAVVDAWQHANPWLVGPIHFVTFFASLYFLLPASIIGPLLMRRAGHRRDAWEWLLAMAGSVLLNQLLKLYFNRPRPVNTLLHTYGLSFPSGHAMMGLTFYGCLAWLLARHFGQRGWAVPLLLWAGLIGLTRVCLHAHYATDVLAGFAGGAAWLVGCRAALKLFWKEEQAVLK
ncbi:phosphatase PAP2 family protein [Hymenobacter sp. 5317J-9]|uniref:phosphatase PAP2 family protein n=1 Tax=Hymenobacter sp. 5317J-9 TaxID=2932250 RepID=UPI001FD637E6|nr:phosphatase PAP2 family protein [Hymenobacter sp. 5317J-9]UOQ96351.1 phosphatase PAP2 family protein [Hymenobacter sp. 5317J-9]